MQETASSPQSEAEMETGERIARFVDEMASGLIGHKHLVESLMVGLLTGGHLLIEGPPGLAKTRAVKRLSEGLDTTFSRIQCTPDLMPADLTGTQIFRPESGDFEFSEGPLFHSLVLVDEINRAPPKVQSALLEAMAENQVTAGGNTHHLPKPFMVVATQNSIEHEGTFPLPEAQLDRFMMHVLVDFPDAEAELAIINLVETERSGHATAISHPLTPELIAAAQEDVSKVHLSPALKDYIVALVVATRQDTPAPEVFDAIQHPVSPRGSLALATAAKARAYLRGRDFAIPDDVATLAPDILAHRLVPTWRATADGSTARGLVRQLLDIVHPL